MNHLLAIERLSKHFGGVMALDELDLTVRRNEILGLIGPNGSGKTTFFNVVTGIYAPDGGKVAFEGQDITGFSPQEVYRAGIARTFQRSRLLLPLSILDNIVLGEYKDLLPGFFSNLFARKSLAAQYARLREKARDLLAIFDPDLAGDLHEPVANLPMISRRRIEICRALIAAPKLLLLDEPSAGMTHEETSRLVGDILRIKESVEDLTIIIIEHEMKVMEKSTQRCAVLNFGSKICEGTYQEVASDRLVQEAYLGV